MRSHLFVYGTLRSWYHNRYARMLRKNSVLLGPARMQGRLYRVRMYRAIRRSRDPVDQVTGELYRLRDLSILSFLDEYEGPRFPRVLRTAHLEDGTSRVTWVYERL
jgi:gamma-glutamylcyclotransferase (GGCT)/AIG2-like uncharacterized protein YtfP